MKRDRQSSSAHPEQSQGDADRPRLLSQKTICFRLDISDETWRRWRKLGRTPAPVDMPGYPRWREADIVAFEQRLQHGAPELRYFRAAQRTKAS
jgi:hypothetical protein